MENKIHRVVVLTDLSVLVCPRRSRVFEQGILTNIANRALNC